MNDQTRLIRKASAPLLAAAVFAAAILSSEVAEAQLMVSVKFNKTVFVAHEPIEATVTVMNRAGQDIVLAGPNKTNWLSFEIERNNELVAPGRPMTATKPYLLLDGQTMQKKIVVNSFYAMSDYGTYGLKASVYLPTFNKFYSSSRQRINVTSGREVWKQGYGARDLVTGRANVREYSLLTHTTGSSSEIYVRVRDKDRRRILSTYSIGPMVNVGDPQVTLDGENNLHVLHMGAPRAYAHTVVDGQGEMVKQEFYKDGVRDKPILKINKLGGVRVEGGVPLDPDKQADIVEKEAGKMVRRASERPPGLPKF